MTTFFHIAPVRLLKPVAFLVAIMFSSLYAQTEKQGVIENEVWTAFGSPYVITDNISVVDLEIDEGVTIQFNGDYQFEVVGRLLALGTFDQPITFTRSDDVESWGGIFFNASGSKSEMAYCRVEYANNSGARFENSSPVIRNSIFANNSSETDGGGVNVNTGGDVDFFFCVFTNNTAHRGAGAYISPKGTATFQNCAFTGNATDLDNGSGGGLRNEGPVELTNCLIAENTASFTHGGGIYSRDDAVLTNCTIVKNGNYGVRRVVGEITIRNSIVFMNTPQQMFGNDMTGITAEYSNIEDGFPGEGNINVNPIFEDEFTYALNELSPSVDAGAPDTSYFDVCFPPSHGGMRNDMGAYGGPGACNWILESFECEGPSVFLAEEGGMEIGQRIGARDGDTLVVDVRMRENPSSVDAFGFRVLTNPEHLSFLDVIPGSLAVDFEEIKAEETPAGEGAINVGGIGGDASIAANNDGVLVQLRFIVHCEVGLSSNLAIGSLSDDIAGFSACGGRFECLIRCVNNGDVNGDELVTPGDAQCAFLIFLNDGALPEDCDHDNFACALLAADSDCDGTTTPGDALAIFERFLLGMPPEACFGQASLSKTPARPARLNLITQTSDEDEEFILRLSVDQLSGLDAFGLTLSYPIDQLEFTALRRTAFSRNWTHLNVQENVRGHLTIGGFHHEVSGFDGEGEFVELVFKAKNSRETIDGFDVYNLVDDLEGVSVENSKEISGGVPLAFKLHQSYPNPFANLANNGATIKFDLPGREAQKVELAVYNITGQLVRTLVKENREPGAYQLSWDGRDRFGRLVPSGAYFYRIKAGDFIAHKQLIVVR